ncbi:MAG: hypothetical protein LH632_11130 [Rhodoferax sp.]|nr:hypothetical protein [Rhodoferax sp.]
MNDHRRLLAAMRLVGGATGRGGHAEIPSAQLQSNAGRKNGSDLPVRPAAREWEALMQRIQPGPIPVEHQQGVVVNPDASLFFFWPDSGATARHASGVQDGYFGNVDQPL